MPTGSFRPRPSRSRTADIITVSLASCKLIWTVRCRWAYSFWWTPCAVKFQKNLTFTNNLKVLKICFFWKKMKFSKNNIFWKNPNILFKYLVRRLTHTPPGWGGISRNKGWNTFATPFLGLEAPKAQPVKSITVICYGALGFNAKPRPGPSQKITDVLEAEPRFSLAFRIY